MRRLLACSLLFALVFVATQVGPVHAVAGTGSGAPGGRERIVVSFRPGTSARRVQAAHNASDATLDQRSPVLNADVVDVPAESVDAAIAAYRDRPDVAWVGREGRVHALGQVSDRNAPDQWNLVNGSPGTTNWLTAYQDGFGAGVIVAVVDTGVGRAGRGGYDGFKRPFAPGMDFIDGDALADDVNGHGTHIAGTIAQAVNNTVPPQPNGQPRPNVAGVAPDAQIMPVRVLDADGGGSPFTAARGVVWAVDHGARIVNLSIGGDFSKPLCDAVTYAAQRDVLVFAASGNDSADGLLPVTYPAACPGAIAVGGHRWDGTRGPYSNGSCEVAMSAPGGDLSPGGRLFPMLSPSQEDPRNGILQEAWDPSRNDFAFFFDSGTSMAAAHASGAAAVLLAPPFSKKPADVVPLLRATARDAGLPGVDVEYGSGLIDLNAAAAAAKAGGAPSMKERVGYWLVARDGGLFSFGDAPFYGSTGDRKLNSPIVAMARTASGRGYWMAAADGGIFTFGDAAYFGSTGDRRLTKPIVGMAASPTGRGYWLVASDGGIFAFGDASFFGSKGSDRLNSPIIGIAPTRSGHGYWLFGADGGVFAFGDALFFGSTGAMKLNAPIIAVSSTPSAAGYWMIAADGGIFTFGDAPFFGSTGDRKLNKPIVGMTPTCFGKGYWLVASDGGIFTFGAAPFLGSTGDLSLTLPIIGMSVAIDMRAQQQ